MSAQHTPGPWAVDGEGAHVASVSRAWEVSAPAVSRLVRPDFDQCLADAHLIAAAPDLLALVRRLAEVYTVDTDSYVVLGLVAEAKRLLATVERTEVTHGA